MLVEEEGDLLERVAEVIVVVSAPGRIVGIGQRFPLALSGDVEAEEAAEEAVFGRVDQACHLSFGAAEDERHAGESAGIVFVLLRVLADLFVLEDRVQEVVILSVVLLHRVVEHVYLGFTHQRGIVAVVGQLFDHTRTGDVAGQFDSFLAYTFRFVGQFAF